MTNSSESKVKRLATGIRARSEVIPVKEVLPQLRVPVGGLR
jgi:hypothetical protein